MSTRSYFIPALLLSLLAPAVVSAQDHRPALIYFANGGGNSALRGLNDAGTASLQTGWSAGGGIGMQLSRFLVVRATFDFARTEVGGSGAGALNGQRLNRYFYGGDVQIRYPTASGLAPYLLLGAGAVTIDGKDDGDFESFTRFAGKGGAGVEYRLRNNVSLFAQGATYVYDYDHSGFNRAQWDLLWTVGVSYRVPR
jgi:hypothetical protein